MLTRRFRRAAAVSILSATAAGAQTMPAHQVHAMRPVPDTVNRNALHRDRGSHATALAIVGGVAGIAGGSWLGYHANIGCLTVDTHCNAANKQVKAIVVTSVLLGSVGAGLGYLAGRLWPSRASATTASQRDTTGAPRRQSVKAKLSEASPLSSATRD
jgi:hypothetical protein